MSAEFELIRAFIRTRRIRGWCIREFPLIPLNLLEPYVQRPRAFHQFPRIDVVCFEGGEPHLDLFEELTLQEFQKLVEQYDSRVVWVLEAKNKLAREVIGDVLFDRSVLPLFYPKVAKRARYGVIVREIDDLYMEIARNLRIEVFVVGSRQLRMLKCNSINSVLCIDLSDKITTPLRSALDIYRHVERYLKSNDVGEVVETSLPIKVEFGNTVIAYWRNEPRCEVSIDEEGNMTINYCSEPCVIVVYKHIPGERFVRVFIAENEPPLMRWAKRDDKDTNSSQP